MLFRTNTNGMQMVWAIITVVVVALMAYFKGRSSGVEAGRDARTRELAGETQRKNAELAKLSEELSARATEISEKAAAIARREENTKVLNRKAEEYRKNAKAVLEDAEKIHDDAYKNGVKKREDELRLLIHSLLSQQPNNRHFSHVLTDAETILVERAIDERLGARAPTTARDLQRKFSESHKKDREMARFYKYQCELYEELVPDLREYTDDEDEIKTDVTKTDETDWLSEEEYNRLSPAERSQLALDRYIKSTNKSKWQIGRDFELFVGHEYREAGWKVEQNGITNGLEDLGRDLICKRGLTTLIVQCKYWSQSKTIHEKHIAQLYGTTMAYKFEHEIIKTSSNSTFFKDLETPSVIPVFITSTTVSDQARKFAKALGVQIVDNKAIGEFPRIKCNVSKNGEKIFHLPFDQQYDKTNVIPTDGDFYAMTVSDAMQKGFRRAKRHLFEL